MSKQDIADFEAGLNKLCEFYCQKLTHAELVGTLDTVKMGYHIETIRQITEPEIGAPLPETEITAKGGSPLPAEVGNG